MRPAVALRPACEKDAEFLARLYATTRDDLAAVALPDAQREALIAQQRLAQTAQAARAHPGSAASIVLVGGEPAGRLIVDRTSAAIHLVDISLLPEQRGAGVGTALLHALLEEADAHGTSVTLSVLGASPARRLYQRLGFRVTAEHELYVALERAPQANVAS